MISDFEFAKTENGAYALDELYTEVTEDLLKTEIDTCWVNVAGENPSDYVRKYTGRAPIVHLKDFVYQDNWLNEVPLFEGLLDVEYLFKLLKSYNVQADMIVENAPSIQGFKLIKEKLEKIINRGI